MKPSLLLFCLVPILFVGCGGDGVPLGVGQSYSDFDSPESMHGDELRAEERARRAEYESDGDGGWGQDW